MNRLPALTRVAGTFVAVALAAFLTMTPATAQQVAPADETATRAVIADQIRLRYVASLRD